MTPCETFHELKMLAQVHDKKFGGTFSYVVAFKLNTCDNTKRQYCLSFFYLFSI